MATTTGTHRRRLWPVLVVVAALVSSCTSGSGSWVSPRPGTSPATSVAASAAASAAADCVATTLATLDTAGRVGQLLMVGTPAGNLTGLADPVRRYRLGGVFLAG